MKDDAQIAESIARFRDVFWSKRSAGRPPVGVVNPEVFLPLKYLRTEVTQPVLTPADITPGLAWSDYEFGFARAPVTCDDFLPFSAPWRAIPWLEAACGCSVRYAAGALTPGHCAASVADLAARPIPADAAWLATLADETRRLSATAPDDCWVSPTILRGPSDILAAMRGLCEFYCDLYDDIAAVAQAAARVNGLLMHALDLHYAAVAPQHGGYGHIFGYWSPERTIVLQEDVLGACSPTVKWLALARPADGELLLVLASWSEQPTTAEVQLDLAAAGLPNGVRFRVTDAESGQVLTEDASRPFALPVPGPWGNRILSVSRHSER